MHRRLDIPGGDVFIHAGDITMTGELVILADFVDWVRGLPHRHKYVIPGNHDFSLDISHPRYDERASQLFEPTPSGIPLLGLPRVVAKRVSRVHLLMDASRYFTVRGRRYKLYGSPWVPNLRNCAFWDRERDHFEHAPRDIDILVTHAPPLGIRDDEISDTHFGSRHIGRYLNRCPCLVAHIFGHVHEGYGISQLGNILFANASSCTREYKPENAPLVIDI
jgi:hypothetical protein